MRTCFFSTSWLEGIDPLGSPRLARTERYLRYYTPLKRELGFQDFWLVDNASSLAKIDRLHEMGIEGLNVYRYDQFLARGPNGQDYPYVWRGIYFVAELIRLGYRKIVYCETDAFILSQRMAHYIRSLERGCTTFWVPRWEIPAAEIVVICEDAFPRFMYWFAEKTWQQRSDERILYEIQLPYTRIEKGFIGDRFGEIEGQAQEKGQDYFTQARLSTKMTYEVPHARN